MIYLIDNEVEEYEKELKEIANNNRRFFNVVMLKDLLMEILIPKNYSEISEGNGTNYASCDTCWFMNGCGSCDKRIMSQDDFETEFFDLEFYFHIGLVCSHKGNPYPKNKNNKKEGDE